MASPAQFISGIKQVITELGQVFTLNEVGEAPREIEGVITTVQNGNAQLVNSLDVEQMVLYTRANVPAPKKFATLNAPNGKRYVIQETHCLDVRGVTVVYKSILKA